MKQVLYFLFAALIFSCNPSGNRKNEKTIPDQASDRAKTVLAAKFDTLIIKDKGKIHEDKLVPQENKKFDKKWTPIQQGKKPRKNPHVYVPPTDPTVPPPTLPVGQAMVFIQFNGMAIPANSGWNGGQAFTCSPSNLPADERKQALYKMQHAYAAYNVYITDSWDEYLAWSGPRHIVVVHPNTVLGYTSNTGVSYVGSLFGGSPYSFVFEDRLFTNWSYVGDIMTHESGHASGLSHQSDCNGTTVTNVYSDGKAMGYCFTGLAWVVGTASPDCHYQDDDKILANNLGRK